MISNSAGRCSGVGDRTGPRAASPLGTLELMKELSQLGFLSLQ